MNKFLAMLLTAAFLATGSAMAAAPKAHHATKHVAVAHKKPAAKHKVKKTDAKKMTKHVKVVKPAKSAKTKTAKKTTKKVSK